MLSFVHLSDSHLGDTEDYRVKGRNVASQARRVVDAINQLPFAIDFVVHSGDVTDNSEFGRRGGYDVAESIFGQLAAPRYVVPGNHDDRPDP